MRMKRNDFDPPLKKLAFKRDQLMSYTLRKKRKGGFKYE